MKQHNGSFCRFLCILCAALVMTGVYAPRAYAACSHAFARWTADESSKDLTTGTVQEHGYCGACKTDLGFREKPLKLHSNGRFLFTPAEFEERFQYVNNQLIKTYEGTTKSTKLTSETGELLLLIYDYKESLIGFIMFNDHTATLTGSQKTNLLLKA